MLRVLMIVSGADGRCAGQVEGERPPIVLIHGFGAALDWWDEIAARLASVTASFASI